MNADFVRDAVSRFGDDPEGIGRFRKMVIGLAIAGKLAGEGQRRSPAEMLDQIESEKIRLLRFSEISKPKRFPPVIDEQLPEGFADASAFAPLGAIARIEKGLTGIQSAKSGSFPLVVTAAERGSCDHFDFEGAATIVPLVSSTGHGNASINRLHYQEGRFALGTILAAIFPYAPDLISARFIFEYLSTFKDELLVSRMTGTANVTLSVGKIAEVPIPLICPTVQRKADALMTLCDQLEAARAEREAARDKLTLSTLAKLNTPDPETFGQDARFALANLAPLTTRPDQIKQLRQTILNLAVCGKLVEQDTSDEPSTFIIEEIAGLIVNGGRRGKRKACDGEPISTECPAGWHWTKLSSLAMFENGDRSSNYPSGSDIRSEGVPFISTKAISNHAVSLDAVDFVSPEKFASLRSGKAQHLDILITLRGSVGKFGLFSETDRYKTGFINAQLLILRCLKVDLVPFLLTYMRSDGFAEQIRKLSSGSATPQLSAGQLASVDLPLPPLAEQHRIVAKVDGLMALCDQLEASLITGEQTRSCLLEAVLHNALEPA